MALIRDVSGHGIITAAVLIVLVQTLHFEILCDREERVEFLLRHIDFTVVHEDEHNQGVYGASGTVENPTRSSSRHKPLKRN